MIYLMKISNKKDVNVIFRVEKMSDAKNIEELIKSDKYTVFKDEHYNEWNFVNQLRKSDYYTQALCLVAEIGHKIIGHIVFTPMQTENCNNRIFYFTLLSIHKDYQGLGMGSRLAKYAINIANKNGYKSIIARGHGDFFPQIGFYKADEYKINLPVKSAEHPLFVYELEKNYLTELSDQIKYCPLIFDKEGKFIC